MVPVKPKSEEVRSDHASHGLDECQCPPEAVLESHVGDRAEGRERHGHKKEDSKLFVAPFVKEAHERKGRAGDADAEVEETIESHGGWVAIKALKKKPNFFSQVTGSQKR